MAKKYKLREKSAEWSGYIAEERTAVTDNSGKHYVAEQGEWILERNDYDQVRIETEREITKHYDIVSKPNGRPSKNVDVHNG